MGEEQEVRTLVSFWRKCPLDRPPFAHPADWPILRKYPRHIDEEGRDFNGFLSCARFGDFTDNRFHLSLLPSPYVGNLNRADIFILLLNPGFNFGDYYAETRSLPFRRLKIQTLWQELDGIEFPFIYLNPEFCWHPGFIWWEEKLRRVLTRVAKEHYGGSYVNALRSLAGRIACLELIPYHSPQFGANLLLNKLQSVKEMLDHVANLLVPAARQNEKMLIVTRKLKAWNLPADCDSIVRYEGGPTRGAHMGPDTLGGSVILQRYGILT